MTLVDLLIWVAVLVIVIVVLWFLFNQVSLPEPIRQIVLIVGVVAVAVIAIIFLLNLRGGHWQISALSDPQASIASSADSASYASAAQS